MKKVISIILICCFFSFLEVNVFAKADSKSGEEKFYEYISTLSEKHAALILSDDELVTMMKSDSYWESNEPHLSTRNTYNNLPVPGYPHGSYYTVNGRACTCHPDRNNLCTDIFPDGWTGTTIGCYNPRTGTKGNCKEYTGTNSMQCKGFADHIYYLYNDTDVSSRYSVNVSLYTTIPYSTTNAETAAEGAELVEDFFSSLPIGSNIRVVVRSTGGNHSIIISNKSADGITVYDANSDGKTCIVKNQFFTWSELSQKYSGIVAAWRGL